ncbi:MAG: hypothetical protein F6K63_32510 [Moorea sp. SIO1G6]|uniref:hypothetical protein n=1 Tax=Moorena sp. SIO1G6 TaxID=2607840 RepID=UPI0013BEDC50|nr:hypothetical protein [Moorena sp. SIO1G6]NET68863.1 hypothetical protein [Moorena sp. SIO1G6]
MGETPKTALPPQDRAASLLPTPVLMQSLMGETTAVAHGGDPQDRAASPRPRCIATPYSLLPKTQDESSSPF